ncbi:hypothetical protein [Marinobacterium lutimaris]|uniref:Uncharacterized protein n=1 Tax=Marinobacterium lutimaris TaxID=568106 RepID=A0A1H6B2D6_9GAMM|nr:hypothetical protein [Marinobacterium lutimaris]SEG54998.1 hypothetical protein SAMN05444390_102355 [Marinobacterium lutimaris]
MKRLVIHIGMHKTGSSSIQETFCSAKFKDLEYLNLGSPNHSGFFATLFWENPENYHGNIKAGRSLEDIRALRTEYKDLLLSQIRSSTKNNVMISAEDLSHPGGIDRVRRLKEFFEPYFDDFKVYAYVRTPASYMESAFQQMVKGGIGFLDLNRVYPQYRSRFEVYDQVFGEENVTLIPFDKKLFHEGDVVLDIAYRLGENISKEEVVRVNESLSLEATSLMYVYRKYGPGYGSYKGATRDNNRLISALRAIGGSKLKFHKELVEPILAKNLGDKLWIENRINYSFQEELSEIDFAIRSEKDIIEIARSQSGNVSKVLQDMVGNNPQAEIVAKLIDAVRYYISGAASPNQSVTSESESYVSSALNNVLDKDNVAPPVVFRELAIALEKSGDFNKAKKLVEVGLKVNPNAPGLRKVYERLIGK